MPDKDINSNAPSNDNEQIIDRDYLAWFRDLRNGNFKSYLRIAKIFEHGYGVKRDLRKAINAYEKYYESYRKQVSPQFDVVKFVIDIGNKHKSLGNDYRAAEWYLKASMHIIEEYNDEKKRQKIFKKYKLEKLLKETGYHNIV